MVVDKLIVSCLCGFVYFFTIF